MAHPNTLKLFSETNLGHKAAPGYPISSPTLDLTTSWNSAAKSLLVNRPPGQVVSKIHQAGQAGKPALEVVAVRWRPDGQFFAVGWTDGVVRLMGLENNKAAHHIQVCNPSEGNIAYIGWASSRILDKQSQSLHEQIQQGLEALSMDDGQKVVDLPRELTFLEVDTALPRLSPLPSGSAGSGEDALVFTLRTGLDFLFQPLKPEDQDKINVMVVGTTDGRLHLSIYDSFVIGSSLGTPFSVSEDDKESHTLIRHAFHPDVSTQALVMAKQDEEELQAVYIVPMDLPFISSSPINLSLLASKLTTLQKLLRYLKQTQLHMKVEWQNTKDVPRRLLSIIEEDLDKMPQGPRKIIPALFHLAVTGHAHAPLKEWLLDSLTERGHKRWERAVVAGLEGLRSLVHENYLPVLDRCAIILSRLRGLALFHDNRADIGFSVTQISRAMDIVSCLVLLGHKILVAVMDELEHFRAFSTWLRFQIDRLASSANAHDELTDKEATMDHSKALAYIENYLTSSPLDVYFLEPPEDSQSENWTLLDSSPSLLDVLDNQLHKPEDPQVATKSLMRVDFLVKYLASRSDQVFHGVAEAKKRSIRFGDPMKLSTGHPISRMDFKMCRNSDRGGHILAAVISNDLPNEVFLYRATIDIVNGISTNRKALATRVSLGDRKAIDLGFREESTLVVACQGSDASPAILSIALQHLAFEHYDSELAKAVTLSDGIPSPEAASDDNTVMTSGPGDTSITEYRLPDEHQDMKFVQMEVHDAADVQGEVPARICLLGSNRSVLRTFTIDARPGASS